VRAGVKDEREDVKVERVEDPLAVKGQIAKADSPAELDAEARATEALAVQRDWQPDLSGVDLHEGPDAAEKAASIGAAAFTQGNDVYLGADVERGTRQGDHVLAHELAHVEQAHGSDEIHRFPATALTQGPVDWTALTSSVVKPGEGLAGGVYIMTSNMEDAPIKTAVAKPVFQAVTTQESGEALKAGDDAMRMMGLNAPVSRVVKKGTAEYEKLITVTTPKAPPKPNEGEDPDKLWHPMTDAKSFVVMGEVPDGKSVKSMAEKAGKGGQALTDLTSAVLSEKFLGDLGKMCIVDMLIGNFDRLVAGKTNLGNVMVSVMEGKASPWAIDTTAMFGKAKANDFLKSGTASQALQRGRFDTKKDLDAGSAETLRYIINAITGNIEDFYKKEPPTDGKPPHVEFTETWTTGKANFEKWFNDGWEAGLAEIKALVESKEGRDKLTALTDGTDDENLQSDTMQVNAQYLAARAKGGGDEEKSRAKIAGKVAMNNLQKLDLQSMQIPVDAFHWSAAPPPPSGAYTADFEKPAFLETRDGLFSDVQTNKVDVDDAKLNEYATMAFAAKNSLQQMGTKSRGVVKKKEVPRNRVLAGSFAADTYYLGAGAWRAIAITTRYAEVIKELELATNVIESPDDARPLLPVAKFLKSQRAPLEQRLSGYNEAGMSATKALMKLKAAKKPDDAFRGKVAWGVKNAAQKAQSSGIDVQLKAVDALNPDELIAKLTEAAKPKPQSQPSTSKGPSGPGKPMIGSRGRR
jgi:hypothetical protein